MFNCRLQLPRPRIQPNHGILGSMLRQHARTNDRMDKEEVERATEKVFQALSVISRLQWLSSVRRARNDFNLQWPCFQLYHRCCPVLWLSSAFVYCRLIQRGSFLAHTASLFPSVRVCLETAFTVFVPGTIACTLYIGCVCFCSCDAWILVRIALRD
jgi:hypothetical protein